ncbi:hypothetical protein PMI16_01508 [Herbaspirillum sp. CF444]|uniref:hypothetical protein n=1 Tax=Herbaspirillum sp. CF444 TaxID=1144319 RepID=UPI000272630F|nr:hypothetical protein [Herbaspirillum sp. CF444]EJL91746.1 hypothetical protein PMI16_01508 [Herbaspirillum sp. CF444]
MTFPRPHIAHSTGHFHPHSYHPALRKAIAMLSVAAVCLLVASTAFAAATTGKNNAELNAQYQREKAACTSGQSNQDKATCLREAGAAYQQARQGKLDANQSQQYSQNAVERCKSLPTQDQADCQRRIDNPTEIEGNALSGGILRKEVTVVPASQ